MGATTNYGLPYPEPGDSVDVPRDIKALADRLEASLNSIKAEVVDLQDRAIDDLVRVGGSVDVRWIVAGNRA